ncbi:MAG: FliM/FliN family flagellar motor switch protein [Treponema sp.]|nr:FliM/FliN family flagellar motor switch protein [Candidatus Treponema equifaecale]
MFWMKNKKTRTISSNEEIDNLLLKTIKNARNSDEFNSNSNTRKIRIYDFKHPKRFNAFEIEQIEKSFEDFCKELSKSFSTHVSFKPLSIKQQSHGDFIKSISEWSYTDQRCFFSNFIEINIENNLIEALSDIQIPEDNIYSDAVASAVENLSTINILPVFSKFYVAGLMSAKKDNASFPLKRYKIENDKSMLSAMNYDVEPVLGNRVFKDRDSGMCLTLVMQTVVQDSVRVEGKIEININADDLKSIMSYLNLEKDEPDIDSIPVLVEVRLGSTKRTLDELNSIQEGSIIELEKYAGDEVEILANGVVVAYGEIDIVDEFFSVRISRFV